MSMFGDDASNGLEDSHFMSNVRFHFDDDPDPYKRRKKNMKNAFRVLKPKRSKWRLWSIVHNNPGQCCVTGIDLRALGAEAYNKALLDPHTLQPMEDGRTLMTEFFLDHLTGKPVQFAAQSGVTTGLPLRSSYCPGLLQIYWLFTQWKYETDMEEQGRNSSFLRSRGIELKPLRRKDVKKRQRPLLVDEIEPFFAKVKLHEGQGIHITEYVNPDESSEHHGEVDIVHITLDLRKMRFEERLNSEKTKGGNPSDNQGEVNL